MSASRAEALISLGRFAEAERLARQASAEHPGDALVLVQLARALLHQEKLPEAIEVIDAAIASAPDSAAVHNLRGRILARTGFYDEAIASFGASLRIDPEHPDTYLRRAYAHMTRVHRDEPRRSGTPDSMRLDRVTADLAASDIAKVIELAPHSAQGPLARAELQLLKGGLYGAGAAAQTALEIDPELARAHEIVGIAAEGEGNIDEASKHYVAAGQADPTDESALQRLRQLERRTPVIRGVLAFLVVNAILERAELSAAVNALAYALVVASGVCCWLVVRHRRDKAGTRLHPTARRVLAADQPFRNRKSGRR